MCDLAVSTSYVWAGYSSLTTLFIIQQCLLVERYSNINNNSGQRSSSDALIVGPDWPTYGEIDMMEVSSLLELDID